MTQAVASHSEPDHEAGSRAQQHVRLGPKTAFDLGDLHEAWQFRELFWVLAIRDVKVKYKQTIAGVAWVVLQPIITAAIFTVVFAGIAGLDFGKGPSVLAIFAGVTAFELFNQSVLRGSMSLISNNQLVRKIYFPRILMPLSAVTSAIVDWVVSIGLLLLLLIACNVIAPLTGRFEGSWPGWEVVLWPVTVLVLLMIGVGLSFATAGLAAIYRDVTRIVPTIIKLVMYASPVMYDLSYTQKLPRWLELAYLANPMAGVIAMYRYTSTGMGTVHWGAFAWSCIFAVLSLVIGYFLFRRHEKGVADVI